jgi:hypothetical protein
VAAGATLAPGTSIGTFTINSDLTIAGNIAIEVNKSQSPSNDLVVVSGVLTNASNGALTVANLGPGLAVGDKFKPFSKAVLNGSALTVTGAGAVWANNLQVDGSISVAALSQTKPVITSTVVVGGLLVFSGTNGTAGANYYVLSSTNVATPLAAWTRDATNSFGPGGVFAVTNAILPGVPVKFHTLQLP